MPESVDQIFSSASAPESHFSSEKPSERRIQKVLRRPFDLRRTNLLCKEKREKSNDFEVLSDLTIFMSTELFLEECQKAMGEPEAEMFKNQAPLCTVDLSGPVKLSDGSPQECRLHAALCCGGRYYAITLREPPTPTSEKGRIQFHPNGKSELEKGIKRGQWQELHDLLNFDSLKPRWAMPSDMFLTTAYQIAEHAYSAIFADTSDAAGLVLVTGGTGTGKTNVLNGLLAAYLVSLFKGSSPGVRPRVVAVGDPVETSFFTKDVPWWVKSKRNDGTITCSAEFQEVADYYSKRPIDFIPRTIGTDVESVDLALRDALRETTSAYVVSELRAPQDFQATLNFAATGQIIFATAHNTSLVDAIRKLMSFSATPDTPSSRSLLAQRLKAVIHLRVIKVDGGALATLPSLWINNARGIRNFVCDGLSSLLPHSLNDENHAPGVLGRAWAAKRLFPDDSPIPKDVIAKVKAEADALDLSIR